MPCSTLPVLLEQHFGMKSVSTVHGLALSAWAFAGLSGNQLASFVVSHATDAAHRYSALIPIITVLYAVALASIIAVTLATKGKGVRPVVDAILVEVDQVGAACHTGKRSCFEEGGQLPVVVGYRTKEQEGQR